MRKYKSYFKLNFIKELQYRAAALAGMSTQFFFGFIFISVYVAFYKSGTPNVSMTLKQTVTYLWLSQAFLILINAFFQDMELQECVRSGNICFELLRPQKIYFMWYAKTLAARIAKTLLRFFPLIAVAAILPEPYRLSLPDSPISFVLFLITISLGALLANAIVELYPIITLKTISDKGIVPLMIALADLFTGGSVPIPYFPKFLQVISRNLPFQYISDLPFRIYTGNILPSEVLPNIIIQVIWIIILMFIGNILLNKSLKRVVIQGG